MMYAPHTLQLKNSTGSTDEYGHPIVGVDTWVTVCQCRCDDNTTKEFKSENGTVYRPAYHIVSEHNSIKENDDIRCLNANGSVRGEGKVYIVRNTNFLNYSELWV